MSSINKPKIVILCILDGWGIAPAGPGNAISLAQTPNMNKFWASYPHTQLGASGEAVGLPRAEDGNTETGHINLGAGRIVYQDLERINMAIADGSFFENQVLLDAIEHAKKNSSNLHIMGLIGAGGVHSNMSHLFALINLAIKNKAGKIYLHLFTDGRDSPPTSAKTYIKQVRQVIEKEKTIFIASIMGRYWAMDRDLRWDRTEIAYKALTQFKANLVKTAEEAIDKSYDQGKTDEFIEPSLITDSSGKPICKISDNDAVIFFNFRVDRPRQLTRAFVFEDFTKAQASFEYDHFHEKYSKGSSLSTNPPKVQPFNRGPKLKNLYFVTMTEYEKLLTTQGAKAAFPPQIIDAPLSSAVSSAGLRQLKITESEKERFVTYYFNGLREKPFPLEERIIIPSPKVKTYDQKPEMSSEELTNTLLKKLSSSEYQFVLINYPNTDIVGHTGNIGPTVKAVEVVDACVGKVANFTLAYEGVIVITADHGNAEEMINRSTEQIDTEHSANPVPFIVVSKEYTGVSQSLTSGILADVSPTLLTLLDVPIPSSMTGRNLLQPLKYNNL